MASSAFNSVDLAILIIIGISILIGVLRGATREVLGIAGWIGAFAVVFYGLPLFRPLGRQYIHSPMIADAVVAGILFIFSLAVFILISRLISSSVKGSIFGSLDRSLGLVFGFLRGVVFICVAFLLLSLYYSPAQIPEIILSARFTPWIMQGADEIKRIVPHDYLPQDLTQPTINPLDAKDLIENSLPSLEDTVKNLSTLRPVSPKKPTENNKEIEILIDSTTPDEHPENP
jgi:membrane protein required for colicin V production